MKTLGLITLFLLAIIISVGISVYIIRQEKPKKYSQRYQLVFGEILHQSEKPSDETDISIITKNPEVVCFKFDTKKGKTWRYVSSFYKDPNQLVTTLGFELVPSDDKPPFIIYNVTKRGKLSFEDLIPNGFVLDEPKDANKLLIDLKNKFEALQKRKQALAELERRGVIE